MSSLSLFQVWVDIENTDSISWDGFDSVARLIMPAPGDGESVAGRPWPTSVFVENRKRKRSKKRNFFYFFDPYLVVDEQAMDACRRPFERSGEVLTFELENESQRVFLFNPLHTLDEAAVDRVATKYDFGAYSNVTLNADCVPCPLIFRLPGFVGLFLSTRLQPDENDFYYVYCEKKLSGLYFKKLWDEEGGAVAGHTTSLRIDG